MLFEEAPLGSGIGIPTAHRTSVWIDKLPPFPPMLQTSDPVRLPKPLPPPHDLLAAMPCHGTLSDPPSSCINFVLSLGLCPCPPFSDLGVPTQIATKSSSFQSLYFGSHYHLVMTCVYCSGNCQPLGTGTSFVFLSAVSLVSDPVQAGVRSPGDIC